jgi:uncharacterized protein (TIGR03437 family)
MRCFGLILLGAVSLSAQFNEFAVTDDGQLYFSSTLLTGANQDIADKVYRWTDRGPELFASGAGGANIFGPTASGPLVSGDGSITGYALAQPCAGGSCGLAGGPRTFFQLQGAGFTNVPYYFLQVSRNGKYLLGLSAGFHLTLIELPSQRSTDLGTLAWTGPQALADTGAALILDPTSATLAYKPVDGEARTIAGTEGVVGAALSPAGDRIAYERKRGGVYELVLTDPMGSAQRVLASGPQLPYGYQPRFANTGTLLYIDQDQQAAIVPPGGDATRLAKIDAGVQRSIPSGDGRIAWLESNSGQLLRVQMANGSVEEVVPPTPYVRVATDVAFPGSVLHFAGTGINRTTHFRAGDATLPLSALEKDGAAVQIPWDHATGQYQEDVTVQADSDPFFQRTNYFPLGRPSINFEREIFSQTLKAAHQDWRGSIADSDPAAPGETIHVFARNMGPVDQPVATGQPSPSDPPARVTTPFACYLLEVEGQTGVRPRGLVVPFAGLSSGLIGIYHIDVTIPADWTARDAILRCVMDNGGTLYAGDDARITVGAR